ncbi:MAG: methyltransferase domain-containing protein [Candidatus Diapherotrites archaeon]
MPTKCRWKSFFKPQAILETLSISEGNIVDIGSGYGTFTIPAAKRTSGTVFALEIEPELVKHLKTMAEQKKLKNIKAIKRDVSKQGTGLKNSSVQHVLLFNILHCENPVSLLKEAQRITTKNGTVAVIHWNYDPSTPRGPSMDIRPKPEQIIEWAKKSRLVLYKKYNLPPYHYGLVFKQK